VGDPVRRRRRDHVHGPPDAPADARARPHERSTTRTSPSRGGSTP
jgi:hypothetical protein